MHNSRISWSFDLTEVGFDSRTQNLSEVRILLNMEDDRRDSNSLIPLFIHRVDYAFRLERSQRKEMSVDTHPEIRMAIQMLESPIPQIRVKR